MRPVLCLVAALALVGCASDQEAAAEAAARSFDMALRSGDVGGACAALAPGTRAELEAGAGRTCAQALPAQDVGDLERVIGVQRYGRQASIEVQSSGGQTDTWFLSRFGGRWLLVAASCRARPELPYDCDLRGP